MKSFTACLLLALALCASACRVRMPTDGSPPRACPSPASNNALDAPDLPDDSEVGAATASTWRRTIGLVWIVTRSGRAALPLIPRQLAYLNRQYRGTGVSFRTILVKESNDTTPCGVPSTDAYWARKAAGPPSRQGVVICKLEQDDGLLGYTDFQTNETDPTGRVVFLNPAVIAGGTDKSYNLGATLVHEFGHTFGLRHVFSDKNSNHNCTIDNDHFRGTPIQSTPTYGCPERKDSCPDNPGLDNIHNYMDYSDDRCLTTFARGQRLYIGRFIRKYRPTINRVGRG